MSTKNKAATNIPLSETQNQEEKSMEKSKVTENTTTQKPANITAELPTTEVTQEVSMNMKESTKFKPTAPTKATQKKTQTKKSASKQEPISALSADEKQEVIEKVSGEVITSATEAASIHLESGLSFERLCQDIAHEMGAAEKSFIIIAMKLYSIDNRGLLKGTEYKGIGDFAKKHCRLSPTKTSCLIGICKRFGKIDPETGDCVGLLPEYERYKYSALAELVPVKEEFLTDFTSDMSVKQIQRKKDAMRNLGYLETSKKSAGSKSPIKINAESIADLKEKVQSALNAFESSHPDEKYSFSLNLTYEEVKA